VWNLNGTRMSIPRQTKRYPAENFQEFGDRSGIDRTLDNIKLIHEKLRHNYYPIVLPVFYMQSDDFRTIC
jgi:hypothetical protein